MNRLTIFMYESLNVRIFSDFYITLYAYLSFKIFLHVFLIFPNINYLKKK